MKCSNCQKENDPTNRFCIYCGSSLQRLESEVPSEPVSGAEDSLAASFGLIFAGTSRGQASTIRKFSDHPITIGMSSIHYIVGSGLINYPPEAQIVGWLSQNMYLDLNDNGAKDPGEPTEPPVLGCMKHHDGKIVFIGDTNALETVPQPVTRNIIEWFEQ